MVKKRICTMVLTLSLVLGAIIAVPLLAAQVFHVHSYVEENIEVKLLCINGDVPTISVQPFEIFETTVAAEVGAVEINQQTVLRGSEAKVVLESGSVITVKFVDLDDLEIYP